MTYGPDLVDWYPRHIVAMVFQVFSILASSTIILSFFILKNRRSPFHYQVLFLNIADVVWTTSHFINHAEALKNGHVTNNKMACSTMGMFTHLGIGWELCWMIVIALYTATLVHHAGTGHVYHPPRRVRVTTTIVAWGFPLIWWTIIGLSVDAYDNSSGYFCWVKFEPAVISLLFGDIPLIVCCIVVTSCYTYVAVTLIRVSVNKTARSIGSKSFMREVRRSLLYIFVYILWVHPYITITLVTMTGGTPSRGLWIYFLMMVNSMGSFNFLVYGFTEKWFEDMRYACGCEKRPLLVSESVELPAISGIVSVNSIGPSPHAQEIKASEYYSGEAPV